MNDIKVYYPASVNIEVFIINDDTEQNGKVTIGHGLGDAVSVESITERIARFEEDELEQVAPGFRLCTRREVLEIAAFEKTGTHFAVPSQEEFDSLEE